MSLPADDTGIAVLVITDGRRPYLDACVRSLAEKVTGDVTEWWMWDDTGDHLYRRSLQRAYPRWRHINGGPRQGFGGAIRGAWHTLLTQSTAKWIFHVEGDFIFPGYLFLNDLATVLEQRPHLMQMALCRQPWSRQEHEAGGVVECWPDSYRDMQDDNGYHWLEHRLFWTTNPSLYRRELTVWGWPQGARSEAEFHRRLLQHGALGVPGDRVHYGYWGKRGQHVLTEHIGQERAGCGY